VNYAITILRVAQKQLAGIDRSAQPGIIAAIRSLATTPRHVGCVKLSGRPAWRIRIGVYRVIYEIHDARLVVVVIGVGHRSNIYR
jgi:mRNA interferase RelE/StbE